MAAVPPLRLRRLKDAPARAEGAFVLYWMTSARRGAWNFALQRALEHCAALNRPLVILESLRADYPWASDRFHAFVLQGMSENARLFARRGVAYYPHIERAPAEGRGLLGALAGRACAVVTDEYPAFFLPRMLRGAVPQVPVSFEAVDSNGLLPLAAAGGSDFVSAHQFRRFLQKVLPAHLDEFPEAEPFAQIALPPAPELPSEIVARWPLAPPGALAAPLSFLATLPIDHSVSPTGDGGGGRAARERLRAFLDGPLDRYVEERSPPDLDGASGLSPWLHFGHLAAHEVAAAVLDRAGWDRSRIAPTARGARSGWWGLPPAEEAFLDELVTWREVGFATCAGRPDHDRYESLPSWALATLEKHAADMRPHLYSLETLEEGQTHDPLWNAAQTQLRREGRVQNYLRMLWGKKVLEWSPSPREAMERLVHLNNKYALDGRDPNSTSGIFWCLGRYDRPWGPERPVFGTVRYMSSENTARKFPVKQYLARWTRGGG